MEHLEATVEWVDVALGPIIGKVTNTTARILVKYKESNQKYQTHSNIKTEGSNPDLTSQIQQKHVTCSLIGENGDHHITRQPLQTSIPLVFAFKDLEPGKRYSVNLGCELPMGESSFFTLGKQPLGTLRTGVVSCNEISIQESKNLNEDLWADLGRRIRNNEIDYLFHIGDQVYMDMDKDPKKKPVYEQFREIVRGLNRTVVEIIIDALEMLRQHYHRTWGHPSIAYVLANVPNLMVCDDHEFRDDWGFRAEDVKPGTDDHVYGQLSRRVYYEYQRQLREDLPWKDLKSLKCEYYYEILNGVGVSFMEYRGCRSWFREEKLKETHVGEAQKEWINALYKNGGEFDQAKISSAIFISPLPLFFLSHFVSQLAYLKGDDIQEYWAYDSVPQLSELIDLLKAWKERVVGRELLIVGGDCHLGGWTDVFSGEERVLRQFVTSAINNKSAAKIEKAIMDVLMKLGRLNKDYNFAHHHWKRENNYGMVKTKTTNNTSRVESTLVWYSEEHKEIITHTQ